MLAVDAHDLAFGTSRWSSKMVHGGLRYLAQGQFAVAHESAVERGIIMERTAPHLTHAMAMVVPFGADTSRAQARMTASGLRAGDVLRRAAGTSAETLPRPRRLSATEALQLAPTLRPDGLRGGYLTWDGQLEDDARLVDQRGPDRGVVRRPRPHPRSRAERERHRASSCATSSPGPPRPSPHGQSSTPPASGPGRSSPR